MDMIIGEFEYLFCFNISRFIFGRLTVCTDFIILDRVIILSSHLFLVIVLQIWPSPKIHKSFPLL